MSISVGTLGSKLLLVAGLTAVVLTGFGASAAHAGHGPEGIWKSSSGNTFIIPMVRGDKFDIILRYKNGKRVIMNAAWIKGMRGTQFSYAHGNKRYTGTVSGQNPDMIRLSGGFTWKRIERPPKRRGPASGRWQSTSGNIFTIPNLISEFSVIQQPKKGRKTVYPGRWVKGLVGTQFQYGGRFQCTGTVSRSAASVRVVCKGQRTASTWTKVGSGAVRRAPKPTAGIVGSWRGRDGSTWRIAKTSKSTFDVQWKAPNGRRSATYRAYWSKGLVGTQFMVYLDRGNITCTWVPKNANAIQVKGHRSSETWRRM